MFNLLGSVGLTVAILVFLGSAVAVIFLGVQLAKYGDALASLTGWGRLFVGSILVALATSLPELSNNITAVRIDNPQLALGNVVGANMVNMFTMGMVALVFGGKRFLQRVAPEQGYLIILAAVLTGLAVLFAGIKIGINVWQIGLSSIILLIVYLIGMWFVYQRRPAGADEEDEEGPGMTLSKAWVMFGLVSVGVIIAGVFLAQSVDRVADLTGISSGVLGILAVSIVTTMPEASATVAAARMGAADLGVRRPLRKLCIQRHDSFFRGPVLPERHHRQLPGTGALCRRHIRRGPHSIRRPDALGPQSFPTASYSRRVGLDGVRVYRRGNLGGDAGRANCVNLFAKKASKTPSPLAGEGWGEGGASQFHIPPAIHTRLFGHLLNLRSNHSGPVPRTRRGYRTLSRRHCLARQTAQLQRLGLPSIPTTNCCTGKTGPPPHPGGCVATSRSVSEKYAWPLGCEW